MLPGNLEKIMFGVISTPVLHMADRHQMFTHLAAHGPATAADIAEDLHIDPETTERMLLVLTAFEIVQRTTGGRYSLSDEVRPFVDPDSDRYIGGFIAHLVQETAGRTPLLDSYLRRGKISVDGSDPQPFTSLYRDDQSTGRFLKAMWDLSFAPSKELAALAGLAATTHLIDVGGASGPFAVAALQHSPGLRATVFDLPQVEPHVKETRTAHGLGDRLAFVPGNFFTDELPQGDCIAFGYILSDWPDDTCVRLLSKAYRACRGHGRVLVMDRLFDESRRGPLATSAMNLTMHLETQGRHRTADEYIALLTEAGFTQCEVHRTDSDKHLIIGRKAEPEHGRPSAGGLRGAPAAY